MARPNQKSPSKFADDSTSLFPPSRRFNLHPPIVGTRKAKPVESPKEAITELVCILAGVGAVTIGGIAIYFAFRILSWITT